MMDSYKIWFLSTFIFITLLCAIVLFIGFKIYEMPLRETQWIHDILVKKERIATSINGNKIVFCGGSATLFGVRTKDIQKVLGIQCVNMATHASLRIDYMLHRLRKVLRRGDVVILPLEIRHFLYDGTINDLTLNFVLAFDQNYFWSLPLLGKFSYIIVLSPHAVIAQVKRIMVDTRYLEIQRGYDVATLNENGDETSNTDEKKEFDARIPPYEMPPVVFDETEGLRAIKEFNQWCSDNHIECYLTYVNTYYFKEFYSDVFVNYFNKLNTFFEKNHIRTIGTPYDFLYPKELFFDTIHHLNQKGVTIRTNQLIEKMTEMGIPNRFHQEPRGEKLSWMGRRTEKGEGGENHFPRPQ